MTFAYDTQGRPLSKEAYYELLAERRADEEDRWWRVGFTAVGKTTVSTVWLALDHSFGQGGPPLIFETMVFGGPLDNETWRYSCWEEAELGHARAVARVKDAARD